jgi:hypothetical protein
MAKKKPSKKSTKKNPTKNRADKYESKLKIVGTLDQVLKVSVPKN